jgi:UPF0755 protein
LRRTFIIFAVVVMILIIVSLEFRAELESPYYGARISEVFVEIPRHSSTNQIASLLVREGVLRYRLPFILYVRFKNLERRIQAGEYRFAVAATPVQIAQRLVKGDISFLSVTIPEGLTAQETIELLAKTGLGRPDELQQQLIRTDWIRDLDPHARNLEGYLFPETYRFGHKIESETVIKTMVDQFRKRTARMMTLYPTRPGWTVPRMVILASMIEKEVKRAEEAPLVASVMINRLEKKMPLACDPTIIYAMKLAGTYKGNLSKADMAMDSPYNSYTHLNLPPGPIANPGEKSLLAALKPAQTDYCYYVSRNDGTHQFSVDYGSHLNAVKRFQKYAASRSK